MTDVVSKLSNSSKNASLLIEYNYSSVRDLCQINLDRLVLRLVGVQGIFRIISKITTYVYYVCSIGSGQDLGDQNTSPKPPCTSIYLQFLQRSTSTSGRIDCRLKWDLIAEYNSIVPSQQRPVKLLSFASRTARPFIHSFTQSFIRSNGLPHTCKSVIFCFVWQTVRCEIPAHRFLQFIFGKKSASILFPIFRYSFIIL